MEYPVPPPSTTPVERRGFLFVTGTCISTAEIYGRVLSGRAAADQ